MRGFVAGVALVVFLCLAAGAARVYQLLAPRRPDAAPQMFTIAPGEGLNRIAHQLEDSELVNSAVATKWFAVALGLEAEIKAGEYELSAALSTEKILERLAAGQVKTRRVAIPEGIRVTEIAQRLEDAGLSQRATLLALANDPGFARSLGIEAGSLEGYLYPETYHFARGLPPEQILRSMVEQFTAVWGTLAEEARGRDMTRHEIVTLASIVEKETAAPEERPLIAAVFLNRLRKGMRLETDPTVIYGISNFDGNLRRRDLENRENPYNTYRIAGLPPGPIASPGADALQAVIHPAESDFFYFVSRNDGTHKFSKTYREHVDAVNKYQRRGR